MKKITELPRTGFKPVTTGLLVRCSARTCGGCTYLCEKHIFFFLSGQFGRTHYIILRPFKVIQKLCDSLSSHHGGECPLPPSLFTSFHFSLPPSLLPSPHPFPLFLPLHSPNSFPSLPPPSFLVSFPYSFSYPSSPPSSLPPLPLSTPILLSLPPLPLSLSPSLPSSSPSPSSPSSPSSSLLSLLLPPLPLPPSLSPLLFPHPPLPHFFLSFPSFLIPFSLPPHFLPPSSHLHSTLIHTVHTVHTCSDICTCTHINCHSCAPITAVDLPRPDKKVGAKKLIKAMEDLLRSIAGSAHLRRKQVFVDFLMPDDEFGSFTENDHSEVVSEVLSLPPCRLVLCF